MRAKRVKRLERSNRRDTALFKTFLYLLPFLCTHPLITRRTNVSQFVCLYVYLVHAGLLQAAIVESIAA